MPTPPRAFAPVSSAQWTDEAVLWQEFRSNLGESQRILQPLCAGAYASKLGELPHLISFPPGDHGAGEAVTEHVNAGASHIQQGIDT